MCVCVCVCVWGVGWGGCACNEFMTVVGDVKGVVEGKSVNFFSGRICMI